MLMCNLRFLYEDRVLVQLTPKLTMGQDNVSKLKKKSGMLQKLLSNDIIKVHKVSWQQRGD